MFFLKYDVSDATLDYLADSFHWALDHGLLTSETPLVTPTKTFFTAPRGSSAEVVGILVQNIKDILRIPDAPIEVAPLDHIGMEYRHDYTTLSTVAGTWQSDGNSALLRYDPELAGRPVPFISTLVHEVLHHRLHMIEAERPGGSDTEEIATDLHCITTGFGLFQIAGAELAGWQGYLRQPTRAHALAMFMTLRGISLADAAKHLPPRSLRLLRRALRQVSNDNTRMASLQARMRVD